jgi:MinD superfamily P-loop ATPase
MFKNYDLIAVVGLKGGAGKTNTAWHILPAVLQNQNTEFKVFEIDDNNNSYYYINSNIITPDLCQTVRTGDKNIVAQIVVDTIAGERKIIVDGGGGNDSRKAIELIKSVGDDVRKLWVIPFDRNIDNFESAIETSELIGDPHNTIYVLNGYTADKSEFDWFFDKKIDNFVEIPWSELFHFSQKQKLTVFDLAQISKSIPKSEIKIILKDKFTVNGELDQNKFIDKFNEYLKSEKAAELLNEVFDNFAQKKSQNRKK